MAPGGPSMPWARSACPVYTVSVPGPFLPRAGPWEEPGQGREGLRIAMPHSCRHLVPCSSPTHSLQPGHWVEAGLPHSPCAGMPNTEQWRWQCQPSYHVPSLIREQEEGPAPPQGAGMNKAWRCRWEDLSLPTVFYRTYGLCSRLGATGFVLDV